MEQHCSEVQLWMSRWRKKREGSLLQRRQPPEIQVRIKPQGMFYTSPSLLFQYGPSRSSTWCHPSPSSPLGRSAPSIGATPTHQVVPASLPLPLSCKSSSFSAYLFRLQSIKLLHGFYFIGNRLEGGIALRLSATFWLINFTI